MPFDPTKPAAGSPLDSAEIRAQLTALHTLIPQTAVVDSVLTGSPGADGTPAASATATLNGGVLHLSFVFSPGPPGEVTAYQLNQAISVATNQTLNVVHNISSANTNGVTELFLTSYDNDLQAVINKLNELILALRR